MRTLEMYISYSHRDKRMKDSLITQLVPLERQGLVHIWHDEEIKAGGEWHSAIRERLEGADVIVILLSPNYLVSKYCMDMEAAQALWRADRREVSLIPVILKECDWHSTAFGKLQVLPKNGKAINESSKRSKVYYEVALGIKKVVDGLSRPPYPYSQISVTTPSDPGEADVVDLTRLGDTTDEENAMNEIDVFISHSSHDEPIARRLITLIRSALNLGHGHRFGH